MNIVKRLKHFRKRFWPLKYAADPLSFLQLLVGGCILKLWGSLADTVTRGAFMVVPSPAGKLKYEVLDVSSAITVCPEYEDWMWHYLDLDHDSVFLDVGSHIGKYYVAASKMLSDRGTVIGFEPTDETRGVLRRNIELNHCKAHIHRWACWSQEAVLCLHGGKEIGWNTVFEHKPCADGLDWTLGQSIDSLNLDRVDLVKIDVEGSELQVLQGLSQTIRRCKPRLIVEVSKNREEVKAILDSWNYHTVQAKTGPWDSLHYYSVPSLASRI